jgi:hypothetical protein
MSTEILDWDEMMRWNRRCAALSALLMDFHAVRDYLGRNSKMKAARRLREEQSDD